MIYITIYHRPIWCITTQGVCPNGVFIGWSSFTDQSLPDVECCYHGSLKRLGLAVPIEQVSSLHKCPLWQVVHVHNVMVCVHL